MTTSEQEALVALTGLALFGSVALGWRAWLQRRRIGDSGIRAALDTPQEWAAGVAFVLGVVMAVTACVAQWSGLLAPLMPATAITRGVAACVGLQIQVRLVEEPFLEALHGAPFRDYAVRTGRFFPWLGKRRSP